MNDQLIAEVIADLADVAPAPVPTERPTATEKEYPFYIVPSPPIPGKTAWSIVPW